MIFAVRWVLGQRCSAHPGRDSEINQIDSSEALASCQGDADTFGGA